MGLSAGLRAAGDVKFTMFAALFATVVCRTAMSFIFGLGMNMGVIGKSDIEEARLQQIESGIEKVYGKKVTAAANSALAAQGRPAELTLADDVRDIDGGAVLKDGNIEVNCSLASLIEAKREELSVETAQNLFR